MVIFNSLGSNYSILFALRTLVARNDKNLHKRLIKHLSTVYNGRTILLYKGREALELALRIANFPAGSAVAISGYTCFVVYNAVKRAGLVPIRIDINKETLNFSVSHLERVWKTNPKLKAVIIQNTLGFPCDIGEIDTFCKKHGILLIEDLAHSVGTIYNNHRTAGTVGDFVALSFSQDKSIDGISGGALIIRNRRYFHTPLPPLLSVSFWTQWKDRRYPLFTWLIRVLYPVGIGKILHWGMKCLHVLATPMGQEDNRVLHTLPPWYARSILGSFLGNQKTLVHRQAIGQIYATMLPARVLFPKLMKRVSHASLVRFPIRVENRDRFIDYLSTRGIHVSDSWYDAPISPKRYMSEISELSSCPHAEYISSRMVNLPTHRGVSIKNAQQISAIIQKWLSK